MSSIADIGEFALIHRLVAALPAGGARVGPGDDAAVVDPVEHAMLLAADLLIQDRHFDLAFSSGADVGYKSIAVNASDIAAMGGTPRYALVSIGVPARTDVALIEEAYRGIARASSDFGVAVVGGDTVGAPQIVVSVAIVGEASSAGPVLRSGARAGDALCVTGALGAAAAGLLLFRDGSAEARTLLERRPALAEAHRLGRARVAEGRAAAEHGARAMIDISDGLVADVEHLCRASGVGASIDGLTLPVADGVADAERVLGVRGLAATGGDDYELAIAIAPERVQHLARALAPTPLTLIGVFEEGSGVVVGGLDVGERAGWDHFAG